MTTYTFTHFNTAAEIKKKKLFIDLTIIVNCVSIYTHAVNLKFSFNVTVVPLY